MKVPAFDWLVVEWRKAESEDTPDVWNQLWWEVYGAGYLALDLGLFDISAELQAVSMVINSRAQDAYEAKDAE